MDTSVPATRCVAVAKACRMATQALLGAAIAMIATADSAWTHVHTNEDGTTVSWYPIECCHSGDCRPVASIRQSRQGQWMTTVDGVTILTGPRDEHRLSKDTRWHICIGRDDTDTPFVRCIFEPANS